MKNKIKNIINFLFSTLSSCVVPILPIMIATGMVKVLIILFTENGLNILPSVSPTVQVLTFVADAGFYFMPIFMAVSAAEVFKTNKFIAAFAGASLLSPVFVEIVNTGTPLSIYGIKVPLYTYQNQIIPSILIIYVLSHIERILNRYIPDTVKAIFVPLLCTLTIVPIALCAIGPAGLFLSGKLVDFVMVLKEIGPIGNGIMVTLLPFITAFGLGGGTVSALLALAATGVDPILLFANILYNTILGVAVFAVYLKDKNPDRLAASITSAIAGTSEPALFGTAMKDSKVLISVIVSGFVSGFYSGLMGVKTFVMASFGLFGIISTIGPGSSIVQAAISLVIGCVISFIMSYLLHKDATVKE